MHLCVPPLLFSQFVRSFVTLSHLGHRGASGCIRTYSILDWWVDYGIVKNALILPIFYEEINFGTHLPFNVWNGANFLSLISYLLLEISSVKKTQVYFFVLKKYPNIKYLSN